MDITKVAAAAEELRALVGGDGADLWLVRVDAVSQQVEFQLDLSAAGCGDCVLPPSALKDMVDATIKRSVPGDYAVLVDDPRTAEADHADRTGPVLTSEVTIVGPAAVVGPRDTSPGPDAGDLRGKTVGFRVDVLWRSWDWVADEWRQAFARDGVKTEFWRRVQGQDGAAGDTQREEYAAFLNSVDAAVVGLGNCGSCTSHTIKDAVAALDAGLAAVGVTTAHFEQLGHALAELYGRPGLRLQVLPYPLDTRSEDEVRRLARDAYPSLVTLLGAIV
jgi:Fe-S cluster biogenesis protein NfuA